MIVLVDADYLVYSAGFAAETARYLVEVVLPTGEEVFDVADTATAARIWLHRENWPLGTTIREPHRVVDAEPLRNAKQMVRQILKKIKTRTDGELKLYLTGKNNYRNELATIRPYKGNRAALHKPYHYEGLRAYLLELGAEMVDGREADDQVAIDLAKYGQWDTTIIASVDKDLRQVPGTLYNWVKDTFEDISKQDGLVTFYRQCLTGDVTDNIVGCYKCGEGRAWEVVDETQTEREMYDACLEEFERSLERKGCPYAHLSASDALLEIARLVYLQRREDELWQPPALRAEADTSVASWLASKRAASATSTSPTPSTSSSTSPVSSAKRAASKSGARRGTRPTSASSTPRATPSTSKRKASSRRTSGAGSKRSLASTSKASDTSSSASSSCETTG